MSEEKLENTLKWSRKDWVLLAVNIAIFAILFVIFNRKLPDEVASHYNISGELDRMMGKVAFWIMYGAIGILLPSFLAALRKIDPRKQNYNKFAQSFYVIRFAISMFIHGIMLVIILDNLDYNLPIQNILLGGFGLLWIVIGNYMSQVRSNFFVGIKTPWALSDERNWRLTHRFAARFMFIAGILMFASTWFVGQTFVVVMIILAGTLISSLSPVLYSYLVYRNSNTEA
ncbi:MAG: SdpI family protein [Candidatus Cohnella colombiensis]|uniref:SdpI family protein n=1 Tax=Candidatus Cohnella colombiensis TaxID=3121368 RepID=A0AA95EVU0_9BACL|nr:MAG: SdpI family protein [Cohnella sp.]